MEDLAKRNEALGGAVYAYAAKGFIRANLALLRKVKYLRGRDELPRISAPVP